MSNNEPANPTEPAPRQEVVDKLATAIRTYGQSITATMFALGCCTYEEGRLAMEAAAKENER